MNPLAGSGSHSLGRLVEVDATGHEKGKKVDFHFNPKSLKMSQGAAGQGPFGSASQSTGARAKNSSQNTASSGASPNPPPSQKPVTLEVTELWFDGGFKTSVRPECEQLFRWLKPSSNGSNSSPTPPASLIDLWLGSTRWIRGHLQGLSLQYQIFNSDGEPTRAKVTNLKISADDISAIRQNPTSGGVASYSAVVVGAGETLQSIAHQTYGHPRLWRQLAIVNGFDDPLRVRPGTPVMLPTLNEIVKVQ